MKYNYDIKKIKKAVERIKRFATLNVEITDHFAGGLDSVIEIDGIDDYSRLGMKKVDRINQILNEELGEDAYLECYDACIHVCYIGVDDKAAKGSKYDRIVLDGRDMSVYPNSTIWYIQNVWKELSEKVGDCGSCVLGECFEFCLDGKYYRMDPLDRLQGSAAREKYVAAVQSALKESGCTEIRFDYGFMD